LQGAVVNTEDVGVPQQFQIINYRDSYREYEMKNYGNQILVTIITFVLSLVFAFISNLLVMSKGVVEVNTFKNASGEYQTQIRIENYSKETINGLKALLPSRTDISKISSTSTVKISADSKQDLSNGNWKLVDIALLPSQTITSIYIPTGDNIEGAVVLNAEELKLTYKAGQKISSPISKAFLDALIVATIYAVFSAIILFWYQVKRLELYDSIRKLQDELEGAHKKIDGHRDRFSQHIKEDARKAALVLRRLSDYSKELTFWKDTVRKVMYDKTGETSTADKLIASVTENLRTFSTNSKNHREYEIAEALAESLIEHEGAYVSKSELSGPASQ